jgi:fumarylacetoacetase
VSAPIDETHDAELRSWVESANEAGTEFPIQNLPLGCRRGELGEARPVVAIGDRTLDLVDALAWLELDDALADALLACADATGLNPVLALGHEPMRRLRARLSASLRADGVAPRDRVGASLAPMRASDMLLPVNVGDYTDFYASIDHASNVGSMFRPDNPLLPNYRWVPIGYHGRASSIVPSGTVVRRPSGQTREDGQSAPAFGPSRRLDYELEVGAVIGRGNRQGEPVPIAEADTHVAGLCLVNDWSARDIQSWEYQPLGPFLAKSFATTISPWVVTAAALAPFRIPASARPSGDPAPLPYLSDPADRSAGGYAIALEVWLSSARMRAEGREPLRVSRCAFDGMYWTFGQMVAHHTSNGCNLRPGDLLASGTVSGPTAESRGCLLERTWRGTDPIVLPTSEMRPFLEDGDEVTMRATCTREGFRPIGFGECRGVVSGG